MYEGMQLAVCKKTNEMRVPRSDGFTRIPDDIAYEVVHQQNSCTCLYGDMSEKMRCERYHEYAAIANMEANQPFVRRDHIPPTRTDDMQAYLRHHSNQHSS